MGAISCFVLKVDPIPVEGLPGQHPERKMFYRVP
jgi:hypothetical protein